MITFEGDATDETLSFVKDNLSRLGELKRIEHERNQKKIYYKTIIYGSEHVMVVKGGLTSGYVGAGSGGLAKLLKDIGVEKDIIEKNIYENREKIHSFEIRL